MVTRTCPLCSAAYGGIVLPDCLLCEGYGTVALGPKAAEGPDEERAVQVRATARAIDLHLGRAAGIRRAPANLRAHLTGELLLRVKELQDMGVLAHGINAPGPQPGGTFTESNDVAPAGRRARRLIDSYLGDLPPEHEQQSLDTECGGTCTDHAVPVVDELALRRAQRPEKPPGRRRRRSR